MLSCRGFWTLMGFFHRDELTNSICSLTSARCFFSIDISLSPKGKLIGRGQTNPKPVFGGSEGI